MRRLAAVVVTTLVSCGPHKAPSGPMILEDELSTSQTAAATSSQPEIERTRTGKIARSQLIEVIDAGVGAFLTNLSIDPYFEGKTFWGWKIGRFNNKWVDLLPGDIVVSVNNRPLETPTQVQALWLTLPSASEIVVEAYRNERPFELRFTVQGSISPDLP